jgi:hypothetical protein
MSRYRRNLKRKQARCWSRLKSWSQQLRYRVIGIFACQQLTLLQLACSLKSFGLVTLLVLTYLLLFFTEYATIEVMLQAGNTYIAVMVAVIGIGLLRVIRFLVLRCVLHGKKS